MPKSKKNTAADGEDLDALAVALADFEPAERNTGRSARAERMAAGFAEIQHFVAAHGRLPEDSAERDIFERIYAVRWAALQRQSDVQEVLAALDEQGLLQGKAPHAAARPELDADALEAALAQAQTQVQGQAGDSISQLQHVRSHAQRREAAQDVAQREPCPDFGLYQHLFEQVQADVKQGQRLMLPFTKDGSVEKGDFFVLGGQTVWVAEVGEDFDSPQGKKDARLRLIFSNKTQSNMLRLSLVRALYKTDGSRRISAALPPDDGPLFAQALEEGEQTSGTIYVLRSLSDHPFVAEHRQLMHKIGVTGGKVEARIAGAERDPTYLLAGVEVVATYKLAGIARSKLEALLHRFFAAARLDVALQDRFGQAVQPQEWFLLPLAAIDEAVARIQDGSITQFCYDPENARIQALGR
jgi:hypothetical protein